MTPPPRGFPDIEYRNRLGRAQSLMARADLAAMLLTSEAEIRYFTGFLTRFWESPTRPWFVIIPADGDPVAVIPCIGADLMVQSRSSDIRTWQSPVLKDDGIALLASTLVDLLPKGSQIGVPMGPETHLRMPLHSWADLQARASALRFVGDANILRQLRMFKSPAEVEKIRFACGIADRAFARVPEIARTRVPLERVFRDFQRLCLEEGADWIGYLAGGAGTGGYRDVISPASDRTLQAGDVLMLDTGCVWDGYLCDFDRNFAIGDVQAKTHAAHAHLIEATQSAFEMARPGIRTCDLYQAMKAALSGHAMAGRYGHGLGMQLTEWPSIFPDDQTVLAEGMTMTLEPAVSLGAGRMLVHEENIVITKTGAAYLSRPADTPLPRLN